MNIVKIVIFVCSLSILMECSRDDSSILSPSQNYELVRQITIPGDSIFTRIKFFDKNTGLVFGLNGVVLKTSDGGKYWVSAPSNISEDIWQIEYVDANVLWLATTNSLYKSIDGGLNWSIKLSNIEFSRFVSLECINENTVWVSGSADGQVLYTSDSGLNWQTQNVDSLGRIVSLVFINMNEGYALSNVSGISKTTNSGLTWSNIPTPIFCSTICFLNSRYGFAGNNVMHSSVLNDNAEFFWTDDGGNSWQSKILLEEETIWDINFINEQFGLAIAGSLCSYGENACEWIRCGKLYYILNGGNSWDYINLDPDFDNYISFSFLNSNSFAALSLDRKISIFSRN